MIGRSYAGPVVVARMKCRGRHAERREQIFFEELIKSGSRSDLHHTAERVETSQRAITPTGPWLEIQRCGGISGDEGGEGTAPETLHQLPGLCAARRTAAQTRDVRQQILNGDLP